jgi:hypothetical protein
MEIPNSSLDKFGGEDIFHFAEGKGEGEGFKILKKIALRFIEDKPQYGGAVLSFMRCIYDHLDDEV